MKLNKTLSLILTATMLVTTLSVSVATATENGAERVIYEDNFDNYTGFSATSGSFVARESIFTEASPFVTENKYGIYSLKTDENNPADKSLQLDSPYNAGNKLYHPTNMEYLPEEALLTRDNQMKKGNLKLNFSFRIDGVGEKYEKTSFFKVLSSETLDYDLTNDKFTMFNVAAQYVGDELKGVIQISEQPTRTYTNAKGIEKYLDKDSWYDVELIYNILGNTVHTKVINQSTGTEFYSFDHELDWYDPFNYLPTADEPEGSREYNAIQNVLFKTSNGLAVSIDNFKLEYYCDKPEIAANSISITDYKGTVAEDKDAVSPAVVSIKIPFGTIMSEESTNTDTITLKDSDGNNVSYTPEYSYDGYILKFSDCLKLKEEYSLNISSGVQNIMGESFGRDLTYNFTTTDKKPEFMGIESIKIGESVIGENDIDKIQNGDTVDVFVEYANNSENDINYFASISCYNDDMPVYTSSFKGETVPAGVLGLKKIPFVISTGDKTFDKVSVCLWESFENQVAYIDSVEIGGKKAENTKVTGTTPTVTYSYNESSINIKGTADKESKYVTIQILKPDSTFEGGNTLTDAEIDEMVFYRGQAKVTDGSYSLNIRFDDKQDMTSTLKSGAYPVRIFVDNKKLDINELYITSYPDYVNTCTALNDSAKNNDFEEFKRIINTDRQKLNFAVGFAEGDTLNAELTTYFDFIKKNPLDTDDETENSQNFKTNIAIGYVNSDKLEDLHEYIDELTIDSQIKDLCSEIIYDDEVGTYFSNLVSSYSIDGTDEFEKALKESLILSTAKYGNGYGQLKDVLEICGDDIGISSPISIPACKALMDKTFDNIADFKAEYKKNASSSNNKGSSSGGGGGGGTSSSSLGSVKLEDIKETQLIPVKKSFNDIDNYEWATESILGLADLGIINGVSENNFGPSRNVLREEFAKIIVGALGMSDSEYGDNVFADADNNAWFTSYINIASQAGITKGIGNDCFGVGQKIKRQDMAVMIYNALTYRGVEMVSSELSFDDSDEIADYAKTAVSALYNMGVINGVSKTSFAPNNFATRAEAAKMIYGVLEKLQK